MSISYTNRKGHTYFLCRGLTKTGKPRYFFARQPQAEPLDSVPPGYEIAESVNGIVSLVKAQPQLIAPEEIAAVQAALQRHRQAGHYRLAVKRNTLVVYESQGPDVEQLSRMFVHLGPLPRSAVENLERSAQFAPILRFILRDAARREFTAERWCFLGSVDDWLVVGSAGDLQRLARQLIPLLGTEQFFELY
jgi:hypothetical protein